MALKNALIMQNDNGTTTTAIQIDTAITSNNVPVVIDVTGNVGIGTSSPAAKFVVQTAGNTEARISTTANSPGQTSTLRFSSTGAGGSFANGGAFIQAIQGSGVDNYSLAFGVPFNSAVATERLRITSTGNVGIGVTGSINSSKLTVLGETAINTTSLLSSTGTLALSSPADGTLNQCGIFMRAFDTANNPASGAIFTEAISATSFRANLVSTYMADSGGGAYIIRQFIPNSSSTVERLRIDTSGNVGIGTSTPGQKLDVDGVADFGSTAVARIRIGLNGDSIRRDGNLFLVTEGSNSLRFQTNSTERARITSDGVILCTASNTSGAYLRGGSIAVANNATITLTSTVAGGALVIVYDTFSGAGGVFFANFSSAVIKIAGDGEATDTGSTFAVFKSPGSHITTFKSRKGSTANYAIAVYSAAASTT